MSASARTVIQWLMAEEIRLSRARLAEPEPSGAGCRFRQNGVKALATTVAMSVPSETQ
jgi:hypothetical protein